MTINEALYSYLSTHAGLSALVGLRIYPLFLPQNVTYPAVVITEIDLTPKHAMGADVSLYEVRFQFSCWGDTKSSVDSVKAQVISALRDYSGTMGGAGGVVVQRIFYESETEIYEPESLKFHIPIDFIIWHE